MFSFQKSMVCCTAGLLAGGLVLLAGPKASADVVLLHPEPSEVDELPELEPPPFDIESIVRWDVGIPLFDLVRSNSSPGDEMEFRLFEDVSVTLRGTSRQGTGERNFVWHGQSQLDPMTQGVVIVRDGLISATITAGGVTYRVTPTQEGLVTVAEMAAAEFAANPLDLLPELPGSYEATLRFDLAGAEYVSDNSRMIDVMVLYTDDAADAGEAIELTIQTAIEEVNQSNRNSGVYHRVRLIHTAQVEYEETGSLESDYDCLRLPDDGCLDEVQDLRDRYAADIVTLITEHGVGRDGLSARIDDPIPEFENSAFAVVRRNYATAPYYGFARQLGRLFGAREERAAFRRGIPDWYGYAYVDMDGGWRTLMATDGSCSSNFPCPTFPHWSNPDITYKDAPMGIPADQAGAADNRRVLNDNAPVVANFRVGAGLGMNESGDFYGHALALGDFNNDGHEDLAIGAPGEGVEYGYGTGLVYVYQGSDIGFYPWMSLSPEGMSPEKVGSMFGKALAAGDFNSDGYEDLAVGAPRYGSGHHDGGYGMVIVYHGSPTGLRPQAQFEDDILDSISPALGVYWDFGGVLAVGDFDGDGDDDLAVGAPSSRFPMDFYSSWTALGAANQAWQSLSRTHHVVLYVGSPAGGLSRRSRLAFSDWDECSTSPLELSLAAGDFDDDSADDLAIGYPHALVGQGLGTVAAGCVELFRGNLAAAPHSSGDVLTPWKAFSQAGTDERGDLFGFALTSGDFDGDGHADLAVGAPYENFGTRPHAGAVFLYKGSESGLLHWFNQPESGAHEEYDLFGNSLAAGDMDGDGLDDLLVGGPGEAPGNAPRSGWVFAYRGHPDRLQYWTGLGEEPLATLGDGDFFGGSLAVGDINGDSQAELVVGAYGKDIGESQYAGQVFVFKEVEGRPFPWLSLAQESSRSCAETDSNGVCEDREQ